MRDGHRHRGKRRWIEVPLTGCTGEWLGWEDSNLRMTGSKPVALPLGDTPNSFSVALLSAQSSSVQSSRFVFMASESVDAPMDWRAVDSPGNEERIIIRVPVGQFCQSLFCFCFSRKLGKQARTGSSHLYWSQFLQRFP